MIELDEDEEGKVLAFLAAVECCSYKNNGQCRNIIMVQMKFVTNYSVYVL